MFDNREIRMGQIRERVKRAGTKDISRVAEDRRFLLEEVDRLAGLMAGVEHDANRLVEQQLNFYRNRNDDLRTQRDEVKLKNLDLSREIEELRKSRDELHKEYSELTATFHKVINGSRLAPNETIMAQRAMASHVKDLEERERIRQAETVAAISEATRERDEAIAQADSEREIRRRVHARFKRVRREAILAAEKIRVLTHERNEARRQLRVEQDFGLGARKFAALAYRVLESEDSEGEPMWP